MILTSGIAIESYSKLENIINEHLIKNKFEIFNFFIKNLEFGISNRFYKLKNDINIDIKDKQIEVILTYSNAILYMRTLFFDDKDVLFLHHTDMVYVTDKNGVIKQDILKFLNN